MTTIDIAEQQRLEAIDRRFVVGLYRSGRRWHASITHGIAIVGEPGSSTYASSTRQRTFRKAMRTVAAIAADEGYGEFSVRVDVREGSW